ncbi:glycerol-3-phosphate 1-O-acyltransferase PlsY [Sphingomonas mesophila]|uniref:glycerol-3-phosphate 1-O-acyltransferase PlsY n=1 Tax=Sphingomonas mesophila TaxID=2303576 RepID=UPI000E5845B0|nr:glycerol-3-phosphate 1-O-acyltransferase PlsY [Sphingomonas mesophila]
MTLDAALALVLGYLLGSIPFGLVLARLGGKGDIRDIGSGNIGATNVLRTGSRTLAAGTLLLDIAKGAAAVWIAEALWPGTARFAAAGALIGHMFPVWLKFRGGKGVATYLGVLIGLVPIAGLVFALVWIGLLVAARISSLAGMAAAASAPVTALVLGERQLAAMLLAFTLLVIWRHRENIARLMRGTEPRVGAKAA